MKPCCIIYQGEYTPSDYAKTLLAERDALAQKLESVTRERDASYERNDNLQAQIKGLKVDIAGRSSITAHLQQQYEFALLQVRDFERAINAHCSCGGAGPGDGCVACEIYHDATGSKRGTEKPVNEICWCASGEECPIHPRSEKRIDEPVPVEKAPKLECVECGAVVVCGHHDKLGRCFCGGDGDRPCCVCS